MLYKTTVFLGLLFWQVVAVAAMASLEEPSLAATRVLRISGVVIERDRKLFAENGKELDCFNFYWPTSGSFSIETVRGKGEEESTSVPLDQSGVSWKVGEGRIEEIRYPGMNGTSYADGTPSFYAEIPGARATVKKCPVELMFKSGWIQDLLRRNMTQLVVSYRTTEYHKSKSELEPWYTGTVTIDLQTLSIVDHQRAPRRQYNFQT